MAANLSPSTRRKLDSELEISSPASLICCSSEIQKLSLRSLDLNNKFTEGIGTDFSIFGFKTFSKEVTPLNSEMESSKFATKKGLNVLTPSEAELEEFFSAAEKYDQKRFSEKYNYDVVKDVTLEGRYQWLKLEP